MESVAYLEMLDDELRRFHACLGDDLTPAVQHCGDWTLYDLADHLGRGHLWSAAAVTERRPDYRAQAGPRDPKAMRTWFDQTRIVILSVLSADPETEAWTFASPHTVGFWRRRRCLEAFVHRWDAERALGRESQLEASLSADGVSEVFDTMAARQIKRGHAADPQQALRFTATDTGDTWTYGPGEPVAEINATAADLMLLLWARRAVDDAAIDCRGDREVATRWLANSLVP